MPETKAAITRCIFESLALRYRQVLESLNKFAPAPISILHVIGGGSKNAMLNQFTSNALGIPVAAGPMEATAIGNIMIQAKAAGLYKGISDMRQSIQQSVELNWFEPQNSEEWEVQYRRFEQLTMDN